MRTERHLEPNYDQRWHLLPMLLSCTIPSSEGSYKGHATHCTRLWSPLHRSKAALTLNHGHTYTGGCGHQDTTTAEGNRPDQYRRANLLPTIPFNPFILKCDKLTHSVCTASCLNRRPRVICWDLTHVLSNIFDIR